MKKEYIIPELTVVWLKPCQLLAGSLTLTNTPANEETNEEGTIANQDAKSGIFDWDDDM